MKIKIKPAAAIMLIAAAFSAPPEALLSFISAVILHEAGHLITARILDIKMKEITLDLLGARLITENSLISYGKEALLCLAGPAANFLSALAVLPFLLKSHEPAFFFAVSISLGMLNLLPVGSFDGGRILYCAVASAKNAATAGKVLRAVSFFCVFCLWSFSVYLLLRSGRSLSLFVFSLSLFTGMFSEEY